MVEVVFVHGIAVRDENYPTVLPVVRGVLDGLADDVTLTFCYWGDTCGATLLDGGASLPTPIEPAADGEIDQADLWFLLDADPLVQLRVAAAALVENSDPLVLPSPTNARAGAALATRVEALADSATLAASLPDPRLAASIAPAVRAVLGATPTRDLLDRAADLDVELPVMLARAIVAMAMARSGVLGSGSPLSGHDTDAMVTLVVNELCDVHLGPAEWKRWAGRMVLEGLGRWAARRRDRYTLAATPYAGDVARYLTRGQPLRDAIAGAVRAARPPVVLMGHSLGGIACLDLLAAPGAPHVEQLITIGSQASYLYEIDALPGLRHGSSLPPGFPRWTNVYDRRDLLSFPAQRVFPGFVVDAEFDNGAPFPRAHESYFGNREFRALLGAVFEAGLLRAGAKR